MIELLDFRSSPGFLQFHGTIVLCVKSEVHVNGDLICFPKDFRISFFIYVEKMTDQFPI